MKVIKLTKKADALFRRIFDRCNAVNTTDGTYPLWGEMVLAGLVFKREASPFGHPFNYEITDAGHDYLRDKPTSLPKP